jgi:hypothetical protein
VLAEIAGCCLFPAPAGRPLLKKGVNPFCGIVQKHIACHRFAGDVVGCRERMIDLAVEGFLAETDRSRTPGQNNIGESPNFGVQPAASGSLLGNGSEES